MKNNILRDGGPSGHSFNLVKSVAALNVFRTNRKVYKISIRWKLVRLALPDINAFDLFDSLNNLIIF